MDFLLISQSVDKPAIIASLTASMFNTGNTPGSPKSTIDTFELGLSPNSLLDVENSLVFVLSWA